MKIEGIIWLTEIVETLAFKHDVEPDEVEEVFENKPKIRFVEKERSDLMPIAFYIPRAITLGFFFGVLPGAIS